MTKYSFLLFLSAILLLNSALIFAQGDTFYVQGNRIYDPCGDQYVPRGINYSVLDDWNFPANLATGGELSAQICLAHPNAVRIGWYRDYPVAGRPGYSLADLDSVIGRFAANGVVSIVFLGDGVGSSDTTELADSIVDWWTSAPVTALLKKYQKNMMLNIAGEWGIVEWASNPATALTIWQNTYVNAITKIRNAGIRVPIMIDGPDYADDINAIASSGSLLTAADTFHNVILDCHAYWAITSPCDSNDTITIRNKIYQLYTQPFPCVLGESSNWAPSCDGTVQIADPINIEQILTDCQQYNMGWLYWEWYDDDSVVRQLSTDGTFAHLTPIGDTIVNNTNFGLATRASKTDYAIHNFTCTSAGVNSLHAALNGDISIYPNPATGEFYVAWNGMAGSMTITVTDISGREIDRKSTAASMYGLDIHQLPAGIYLVNVEVMGAVYHERLVVE